jgi:diaminopimelate decarboxylase
VPSADVPAGDSEPITLIDETGLERRFRLHDAFDVQEVHYYLVEAVDDPSQVLLLRETGGGLETVDGDEFRRVMTALEEDEVE